MLSQKWRHRVVRYTPSPVIQWASSVRLAKLRQRNAARPLAEVFTEVYSTGRWGEGETFDSGSGSRGVAATDYASCVREVIRSSGARSAVDIGCGDFRVGELFAGALQRYEGVDVVPELIARNTANYGRPGVGFAVLDATTDELPEADICLIRQVLQHLSNDQIGRILRACARYPLVLVTEHWPAAGAARLPNLDKPHGPDTRLDRGSWVDITAAPWHCQPVEEILRVPAERPLYQAGETIRTCAWRPRR